MSRAALMALMKLLLAIGMMASIFITSTFIMAQKVAAESIRAGAGSYMKMERDIRNQSTGESLRFGYSLETSYMLTPSWELYGDWISFEQNSSAGSIAVTRDHSQWNVAGTYHGIILQAAAVRVEYLVGLGVGAVREKVETKFLQQARTVTSDLQWQVLPFGGAEGYWRQVSLRWVMGWTVPTNEFQDAELFSKLSLGWWL